MTEQPTFADLEYQHKKRQTRREVFLKRIDSLFALAKVGGAHPASALGRCRVNRRAERVIRPALGKDPVV